MFQTIVNDINSLDITFGNAIFRLLLSMMLGVIVGAERMRKGQIAGVRTFALISMGSCLAMLLSIYVPQEYLGLKNGDPGRIAAQVITGIGFIGGGTIIHMKGSVRGLTTAAGLWATAGIGLAIGAGFYGLGIFSTALMLALQILMHRFMVRADALVSGQLLFTVRAGEGFPEAFRTFARGRDIQATDSKITYHDDGFVTYEMFVRLPRTLALSEVDKFLKTCGDVRCIGFTAAM